jgi:DNA-binding XRE family transcriptional regulator
VREAENEKRFYKNGNPMKDFTFFRFYSSGYAVDAAQMNLLKLTIHWSEFQKDLLTVSNAQKLPVRAASSIGKRLKLLREEANMTQSELAEGAALALRNLQRHESGETAKIRAPHLRAYEKALPPH